MLRFRRVRSKVVVKLCVLGSRDMPRSGLGFQLWRRAVVDYLIRIRNFEILWVAEAADTNDWDGSPTHCLYLSIAIRQLFC